MADNRWNWLEMAEKAGNSCNWLDMDENGGIYLEMAWNCCKKLKMAKKNNRIDYKWLEMVLNCWKWLKMAKHGCKSKTRKKEFCPAPAAAFPSCSGYAPWILKQVRLESYGQRLISFNGETKIFFHGLMKKIIYIYLFLIFFIFIFLFFFNQILRSWYSF